MPDRDRGSEEEVDRVLSGGTSRTPGHRHPPPPRPLGSFLLTPEQ